MEPKLVTARPIIPPFPLNPHVGQVWLNWTWTGSIWVCTGQGPLMAIRKFTASGSYIPTAGASFAVVECIGGGAAGGLTIAGGNMFQSAGGGGSGGYSKSVIPTATLLAGPTPVTVAGFGGTANQGGTTSFGQLVIANGGTFGQDCQGGGPYGGGGAGAPAGTGDIALPGAAGGGGFYLGGGTVLFVTQSGGLGGALFGGNGNNLVGQGQTGNGASGAANTGAGGSGGISTNAATGTGFGGLGGSGLCVVTEWTVGPQSSVELCDAD